METAKSGSTNMIHVACAHSNDLQRSCFIYHLAYMPVSQREIALSCYWASNMIKKLDLVSCQFLKHDYKKATKEHIDIPNTINRQLAVTQPNQV